MHSFKLTDDPTVKRLRWAMVGAILFSLINTLAGQPANFWHQPATAIRFDGLSIHSQTNPMFDFFLGLGWQAYLAATLSYCAAAFLLVSLLPRKIALVTIFSFIFGHYFGGSNWLGSRWHFGAEGIVLYGIVLSTIIVLLAFPAIEATDPVIQQLRWAMLAAMALDFAITLLGQPGSYWLHPETANEANHLFRIFLARGWKDYLLFDLAYLSGTFLLVSILPRMTALICIFSFMFGHVMGLSTWMFYRWRMGMEAPATYGIVVSVAVVWLAFANAGKQSRHFRYSLCSRDGQADRDSSAARCGC
jgi:hypothetical protein